MWGFGGGGGDWRRDNVPQLERIGKKGRWSGVPWKESAFELLYTKEDISRWKAINGGEGMEAGTFQRELADFAGANRDSQGGEDYWPEAEMLFQACMANNPHFNAQGFSTARCWG